MWRPRDPDVARKRTLGGFLFMLFKRFAAAALAVVAIVVLTGCVQITRQDAAQTDQIGPLRLTTTFCTTQNFGGPSPDVPTNCSPASTSTNSEELVLAYLVPTTITAPATVRLTTADGPLTMTGDPSWAAAVERDTPAPAGQAWVGYRSPPFTPGGAHPSTTDPATVTADADFALPPAADGGPFASGPVTYRVRMGERGNGPEAQPTSCFNNVPVLTAAQQARARRVLRQGASSRRTVARAAGIVAQPTGNTVCFRRPTDPITVDTRDLAILPGGGATAAQGTTVDVPFNARFAGPAGPSFALSVSGPPGTTVDPTFTPGADSTSLIAAHVAVPEDLAPGTYDVRLRATSGGQTRTGTTQLTVTAAPPLPPLTETLDELVPTTLSQVLAGGQPATVGCNVNCAATVDLLMYKPPADRVGISATRHWRAIPTVLLGRVKVPVAGGSKQTVTIPVKDAARDKLAHLGRFTLVIRTTATDRRGQDTPALVRKVRLKPGCAGPPDCVPRR